MKVGWRQKQSDAGPGGHRRTGSDTMLPEHRLQVGRSSVHGRSPGVVWKCVSTLLRVSSCRCDVESQQWLFSEPVRGRGSALPRCPASSPTRQRALFATSESNWTRSRSETTRLWLNPDQIRNSVSPVQRPCVFVKILQTGIL